jgi:hypothetical protein
MKFDIDTIKKTLSNSPLEASPSGCACKFVPITKKWAIKLYSAKFKRDEACNNQQMVYDVGYAPKVGQVFDLPDGEFRYGYITEIVKTVFNSNSNKDHVYDWEEKNQEKIDEIVDEIESLCGFEFSDCHGYNWGIKNKKLIPIDFGVSDFQCWDGYDDNDFNFDDIEQEMLATCE